MTFGERLRQLRLEKNLTMEDIEPMESFKAGAKEGPS